MDSINANWTGVFRVNTDTEGWQHFRRLDPALLISPATDALDHCTTLLMPARLGPLLSAVADTH